MDNIIAEMNSWNSENHERISGEDKQRLENMLLKLRTVHESRDLTLLERITLLINECIILDMVNDDQVELQKEDFSRLTIISQIQELYNDLLSTPMIADLHEISLIAAKENLSYRIALLLQKTHRYIEAEQYYQKSREFSKILCKPDNEFGLSENEQIERDIHFAFCCEYIGTPQNDRSYLVKALKVLLGSQKEESEKEEIYWSNIKSFSADNWSEIEKIIESDINDEEKGHQLISILLNYSNSECVLEKICKKGSECSYLYREAVHVLSHCLNEMNLISSLADSPPSVSKEEEFHELMKTRIMKMISCFLMDSLGPRYATCQATIRAEQGNGLDAISKMQGMNNSPLEEVNQAELDFYLFYFESLFSHLLDYDYSSSLHQYGSRFESYCNELISNDLQTKSEGKDGLLHYSVFALRNELLNLIKKIKLSTNINESFLLDDNKIEGTQCSKYYSTIRENDFSIYVNSQMVSERKKLIAAYNIIKIMQQLKLPFIFDNGVDFNQSICLNNKVEELFIFCRQYNRCRGIDLKKNRFKSEKNEDVNILKIDGIAFDIYGDSTILTNYLKNSSIDSSMYSIEIGRALKKEPLFPKYKLVLYDSYKDAEECIHKIYADMFGEMRPSTHVFYIGAPVDEDYVGVPFTSFDNIDLCFTMAYIYATVERVVAYVLNPQPIYILAPLRNATSYSFQEADSHRFVTSPTKIRKQEISIKRGGIGIGYKMGIRTVFESYYDVKFYNDDVKNACVDIVYFDNDKLYVLRDEKSKLVRKYVHTEFVKSMYREYSKSRRKVQRCRHTDCDSLAQEKCHSIWCNYLFGRVDNRSGPGVISIKGFNAGTKFLQFIRLACEEDMVSGSNLYLFDSKNDVEETLNHFFICIFRENIGDIHKNVCLGKMVSITKVDKTISDDTVMKAGSAGFETKTNDFEPEVRENESAEIKSEIIDKSEDDKLKNLLKMIKEEQNTLVAASINATNNSTITIIDEHIPKYDEIYNDLLSGNIDFQKGKEKFKELHDKMEDEKII